MENPTGNATTPSNPSFLWVEESNQRGTFGILSFCFSTMVICVWNTLHFDIPVTRHSRIRRFFVSVLWMLIAFLAPEALLCTAALQRIDAGILARKAMKYLPFRQLADPGTNYILGQGKPEDVSIRRRASRI
jgi:hypothetical protein